jgi:protein-disulfide isomerase
MRRQSLSSEGAPSRRRRRAGFLGVLLPVAAIVAALALTAILGAKANDEMDPARVHEEVSALLAGLPQHGTTLGSPDAPLTLTVFGDLECPTVRKFVTAYLPSIVDTWVRDGRVKLEYRSLKTDTADEQLFFDQETAAIAAGTQHRMWNFALTFIYEQGEHGSDYATPRFLTEIASQVSGLRMAKWQGERRAPTLVRRVAADMALARNKNLRFTPSFLVSSDPQHNGARESGGAPSSTATLEASLAEIAGDLADEALGDVPSVGPLGVEAKS